MPTLRYIRYKGRMTWRGRVYWTVQSFRVDIAGLLERVALWVNGGPHTNDCKYECDCPCYERGYDAEHGPYR